MLNQRSARGTVRYSESFKLEVIRRMEEEGLSLTSVSKLYDIKGAQTVKRWVESYGRHHLLGKKVIVMSVNEKDSLKRLEQENKQLRDLIVKLQLDTLTNESLAEIACKQLGISLEEFKKKQAAKSWSSPDKK